MTLLLYGDNMPIIIMNIRSEVGEKSEAIIAKACKAILLDTKDIISAQIHKSSLDARKRNDIHLINSVMLCLSSKKLEISLSESRKNVKYFEEPELKPEISNIKRDGRVVIAGFGPAGMFCALVLSEYGYKPIVLERGADVDARVKAVNDFWSGGRLDPHTNVQFGEGGAGTFSDGKLTTRIGDPLARYVIRRFADFGAPDEILFKAKPHIGTDKLRGIVKAIRQKIIENGGEVRFLTSVEDIIVSQGRAESVLCADGSIPSSAVVMAIGHSARDTFEMLLSRGALLQPKPFSVGARIEHTQESVNRSLYGEYADNPNLPIGEYQLSHRRQDGRAAYTFCMCPGGSVVAAASEEKGIVTNGMSEYARDGKNANSALVVSVTPEDFGNHALDGVDFARSLERRAYQITGSYKAPSSTVSNFVDELTKKSCVAPTYRPGVEGCDLNKLFPQFVSDMMKEGIRRFSREMNCFGDGGAILTAPETRTSSPVRILRTDDFNAVGIDNLYPCGEGAGYAGGIVSAAVDGVKTALKIMESFAPPEN